ncbi:MAG: hypothetical protein GWP18_00260 [Proteobacteria bacterium]|nr:hypothetical protein [Pseudomonadota bacterium]
MSGWRYIGDIALMQIQLHEMTGKGGYDLDALVTTDRLRVTPDGPFGFSSDAWIVDRHHRFHPDARHWHASEILSIGFTSHYVHMGALFRQIPVGHAGENVVVEAEEMLTIKDIAGGVMIETTRGAFEFHSPQIMEPCVEFTRFMTERPDADAREVSPYRQKLRHGVRGYVVGSESSEAIELATGDRVSVRPKGGG